MAGLDGCVGVLVGWLVGWWVGGLVGWWAMGWVGWVGWLLVSWLLVGWLNPIALVIAESGLPTLHALTWPQSQINILL